MSGLRITANTLVTKRYLEVTETGVTYCESAGIGGTRHFAFADIDVVARGGDSGLSLQIGRDIVKIPIDYNNAAHRTVVARLVSELRRTARVRTAATVTA